MGRQCQRRNAVGGTRDACAPKKHVKMRKMLGGNVLGFRGNPLGITAMLRKSAATGGDFTATGQEFSARAQQFMAEPWELPAMFGESVAAGWDLDRKSTR